VTRVIRANLDRHTDVTLENVRVRPFLSAAIVAICIGVPLIEAFDRWDQTLKDGNDAEANVVVAALCVGLALSAVHTVVNRHFRLMPSNERSILSRASIIRVRVVSVASPIPTASPPLALRI
jgi:hypothetical protein